MPSGNHREYRGGTDEADYVYNQIIAPAVSAAGELTNCKVEPTLAIQDPSSSLIIPEMVRQLEAADIVIADLTGSNPNVFYELGVRYSLDWLCRRATVLIMQVGAEPPFDVSMVRVVPYSSDAWRQEPSRIRLRDATIHAVRTIVGKADTRETNPIYTVLNRERFDVTPSNRIKIRALEFKNTWQFTGHIALVASSRVESDEYLSRHYRHSTGSGQFYSLEWLLPTLGLAYPEYNVTLFLSEQVEMDQIRDAELILLGGATNRWTQSILEGLNKPFDYIPAEPRTRRYSNVTCNGKSWKVISRKGQVVQDFGVVIWTHLPEDKTRRVLIAFGGTTYGTEAAARFVVEPGTYSERIRSRRPGESIAYAFHTTVNRHRCGEVESVELLGVF